MGTSMVRGRMRQVATFSTAALLLSTLSLSCGNAEDVSPAASPKETEAIAARDGEAALAGAFDYAMYDALLGEYVDEQGLVDYRSLQANRAELDDFLRSMAELSREDFETWPEQERLAFWINAYNAITLERIIDQYPIQKGGLIAGLRYPANSIRQIPGVWKKIANTVMGESVTLDSIEHEILRVKFKEPRIHAAIVCAALSCPPLRSEAFVAERLDEQLGDQSRQFLANEIRFRIDRAKKRVYLSPIFNWFGTDFVGNYNTERILTAHSKAQDAVLEYVSRYIDDEDAQFILSETYAVVFLDYDWTLNEK